MGFSENDSMVRVDFFKESGKWYTTEAVEWLGYKDVLIHQAFADALRAHFKKHGPKLRLSEMTAICLEPSHEYSHPISLRNWNDTRWDRS